LNLGADERKSTMPTNDFFSKQENENQKLIDVRVSRIKRTL
jgi:hypothetical protein